eukprot:TRINITY_DN7386_c0_g1_i1.p1 TRINITY_DN7386_c0_g1~~TRINITY_DN7386_c0_g1_i1.p1  ORF type:complete len:648 (+),score=103.05 TRINITY_DN7386_c0_g1_i1:174-2117(+)
MALALSAIDMLVVLVSLVATLVVGLCVAARNRGDSADYFVGARSMTWPVVGASMFASNIGTEHFIGQAGSAAAGGLGVGLYEWLSVYLLLTLAYLFAPFYLRLGLTTVSQYAEERFHARVRLAVVVICLGAYVLTKLSATLFTGVILVEVLYGGEVNVYAVALVLIVITASYTVAGGLKAVMITDALQMAIFVVGGFAGLMVSLQRVPSSELHALLPEEFFHVVRADGEYAWHAMFLGQPIGSMWYWCIDQFIVQRVLAAKDIDHARSGCLMAACLKFLPPYLLCFPGMVARALYEKCKAATPLSTEGWCGTGLDDPFRANKAYPLLVVFEFPEGLRGLIITAMFMAMLSSLSSVYNSAATILTVDVYQAHWNPDATDRELVMCGRAASVLMTVLTFAWFPVMTSSSGLLFLFVQSVSAHLFPTLVTIFVLGMVTRFVNWQGCCWGMTLGVSIGIIQLIAALSAAAGSCHKSFFKWECMHFNHFAIVLVLVVSATSCIASKFYPAPSADALRNRTLWDLVEEHADGASSNGQASSGGTSVGRTYANFEDEASPKASAGKEMGVAPDSLELDCTPGYSAGNCRVPSTAPVYMSPTKELHLQQLGGSPGRDGLKATKGSGEGRTRHAATNSAAAVAIGVAMAVNLWMWA